VAGKPQKVAVLVGVVMLALVYSGIGYFSDVVPFPIQHRGDLTAVDLCGSMGNGERTAEELQHVLPARGDYSSSGESPPRSGGDTSWQANCIVSGDGDQLLYASAELGWDAPAKVWLDSPRNYVGDEGKEARFRAGSAAVVMQQTAQILVPCLPRQGSAPYHLVVEVHASKALVGSAAENQHALATVALGTAQSAHERADCPLPSKVPATVTGLE
jgi:hypothetical protein